MIVSALLAYAHYLSILLVISSLVVEAFVFTKEMGLREMKILQRADTLYGIAALLVLLTGFVRVYYYGKGSEYYFGNAVFLTKLSLFIVVGLLSIYPTVAFLRWRKLDKPEEGIKLPDKEYRKIRHFILLEVILVLTLPLLAALMARGIG
ncbi:DUF2214 family protein [Fulvivirga sedimenti]|uniref:DUF2214 family protein n=1 Tax=Fulvivirga sedimenti TaxID=2879465 RepID=A0A9X1L042_9BACT|nr:DUF2214 family protein [Fulvivirga sedimenti]MCA6079070.1 DUF2214 family protein [Fulvivirga sedimenti]